MAFKTGWRSKRGHCGRDIFRGAKKYENGLRGSPAEAQRDSTQPRKEWILRNLQINPGSGRNRQGGTIVRPYRRNQGFVFMHLPKYRRFLLKAEERALTFLIRPDRTDMNPQYLGLTGTT